MMLQPHYHAFVILTFLATCHAEVNRFNFNDTVDAEIILPSDAASASDDNFNQNGPQLRSRLLQPVQAQASQGMVLGRVEFSEGLKETKGREYFAFRGIPYASAPVGDLRWSDPVDDTDPWPGGVLDATRHKPFCPQYDHDKKVVVGKEDCLYLNVYTPTLASGVNGGSPGLGVLVFIHGGAYTRGAAASHGPQKLMREDIVLVTMNYRLGVLGFLCTEDETLPGNYGALDQVSALRWVKKNIRSFGGNPEKITLGGFSAGAAFVHFHLLSPRSQGLFQSAIIMSGSANCGWSVQEEPWDVAKELAWDLGCSTSSTSKLRYCLSGKSVEQLIQAQTDRHKYVYWPFKYRPVVDNYYREDPFLPQTVRELHDEGHIASVPVLMGGTPHEGILFALTVMMFSSNKGDPYKLVTEDGRYTLESLWPNSTNADVACDVLHSYYFSPQSYKNLDSVVEDLTQSLTDVLFTSCLWDAASDISSSTGAPVFTYLMTHREALTPSLTRAMYNIAHTSGLTSPLLQYGVSHGDEMTLIFSFPYNVGVSSDNDQTMSFYLTKTWATFINTGRPQSAVFRNEDPRNWTPVQPGETVGYFKLSLQPQMVKQSFKVKEQNLWRHTTPLVEEMVGDKFSWFVATWLLFSILLFVIIIVVILSVIIFKTRRTSEYPAVNIPVLRRRTSRNPSSST